MKMMSMKNKLPPGWIECELKEIFNTSSGGTPKRGNPVYYGGDIPWLKSGELNDGIVSSVEEYITDEGLNNSSAKLFPRGSLLIALYGATVGKLGILDFDSATNQAICCIYQNDNYCRDFLFYYLFFKKDYLINQGRGGTQPNISQGIIKTLIIPVPPLNEQKRIVEKIEKVFRKIDEGTKNLIIAKEQIKKYCQSVLKAAFEGVFYKTTEWKNKKLEQITKRIVGGGTPPKSISRYYEGTIPFMTVKDMISLHPSDTEWHITQEAVDNSSTNLIEKDTIIIATRVGLGKIVRVNFDTTINQDLKALILNDLVDKDFCEYLLKYKTPEIISKGRGTTVKGITLEELRNIKVDLPSIDEQKQIVKEIEKRFKISDEVENVILENLIKVEQLKQSILKKAFEGRLVPQDPTDEPASALLEKIKKRKQQNA